MGRSVMANPNFTDQVQLKVLRIPGEDPELMAEMMDGPMMGELGNLVDWLTTNAHPAKRPYFRIVLGDGSELGHAEIDELSQTDEFQAWKAAHSGDD